MEKKTLINKREKMRNERGQFVKGYTFPQEWIDKKVRPSGLKYNLRVENPSWFEKGFIPWNKGKTRPVFDINTGYWTIRIQGKRIKYHRYLMEQKLKRQLNSDEVVHHIDNDVDNNSLDNLYLFKNKSEHLKHHWGTTRKNG